MGLLLAWTTTACEANLNGPDDQGDTFLSKAVDGDDDASPTGMPGDVLLPITDAGKKKSPKGNGSDADAPETPTGGDTEGDGGTSTPTITECNDGIDNDGDGLVDVQMDLGCSDSSDTTETARPRAEENGFTTFDLPSGSKIVYVSAEGNDAQDGLSPATAVKTVAHGASLIRDGSGDFLLLRRGDAFYDETLDTFVSGASAESPVVVASYGESSELPRVYVNDFFVDHFGKVRNHVAFKDLHLIVEERDPTSANFTGAAKGIFRFVGAGAGLLVEGCHLEFGEIVVQSYGESVYRDVEIRRNVIEKSYHAGTCMEGNANGSSTYRPSGIYSSHVEGLVIEENFFDHNGWNEDVSDACATMYNHNMYLSETNHLVVKGNLSTRPSSMHVKLRSDVTGGMKDVRIENNHFVDGEIGVSMGGNTKLADRFQGGAIVDNVMSDIGRSQPTTRNLGWGIELQDISAVDITGNLILNQDNPAVTNSYGIYLSGSTASDLTLSDNVLYNVARRGIWTASSSLHENIDISSNSLVDPGLGSCLVQHDDAFGAYTYYANSYFSAGASTEWLCSSGTKLSVSGWTTKSGEAGAETLGQVPFSEPTRTLETYAAKLGIGSTIEPFLGKARLQTRFNWDAQLMAAAINDYVRAGFDR